MQFPEPLYSASQNAHLEEVGLAIPAASSTQSKGLPSRKLEARAESRYSDWCEHLLWRLNCLGQTPACRLPLLSNFTTERSNTQERAIPCQESQWQQASEQSGLQAARGSAPMSEEEGEATLNDIAREENWGGGTL